MPVKTREQYLESLRAMRTNVYKFGELITDVASHPATRRVVESHARAFDSVHDPKKESIFTTASSFTGDKIMSKHHPSRPTATATSIWWKSGRTA
jgi:4-hydroxybutyryl-CoA dehydratase/vinylacetyl-CoA-Delta-isomerase